MKTLEAFTKEERELAKLHLATRVASMMGRKLEEGDWSYVYCKAKSIPDTGWSNLNIDVNHNGLGLELKILRIATLNGKPLKSVCGTSLMHPAATRSIRIEDTSLPADKVMTDIFTQYRELIAARAQKVKDLSGGKTPDMRTGWLVWENELTEFLYFEERMSAPSPKDFYAEWNETPAKGMRKESKSLWIYDAKTNQKRYSITTAAGIKIQPYFDVPPPSDSNLYYFRVQGEPLDAETILLWVSASTANALKDRLGTLDQPTVDKAIFKASKRGDLAEVAKEEHDLAVPIRVSKTAYEILKGLWEAASDEHRAQLLLKALI